jgi:hypothetical protein
MSKKKRDKKHHKHNPTADRPVIVKVSAVKRHPAHQWWVDHRRFAKPVLIAIAIAIVVIVSVIGLIDAIW